VCVIFSFSSSFFTPALLKEKHVPEVYHGVIVSISSLFYVAFTILVGYVIDKFPKRLFILVSFGGCALAMLLTGPSYLLGMPNKLWILCIGQALQGAFLGLIFIPIMPEMIEALYASRKLKEGEDERTDGVISDKSAGLYGSFYSIGMIISPIMGSLIYENF
jgi:MFS family permease